MGHGNQFAPLQPPKQIARLQSGSLREGRSLDLTVQPDKRFVVRAHWTQCMSDLICYQPGNQLGASGRPFGMLRAAELERYGQTPSAIVRPIRRVLFDTLLRRRSR
jgi:hypothetical protein